MSEELLEAVAESAAPGVEGETSQESATGEQQESQEGEQKPKGGFQKRIDKLTRKVSETEQEKEYWRQQALRTPPANETRTAPVQAEGKPSPATFTTQAEYLEALTDWKVEQKLQASKSADVAAQRKTQVDTAMQQFKTREQAFREATEDFDDVMSEADDVQISDAMVAEIVNSDHGPELQYYLAKNRDVAKRLFALDPTALAREIGRIEARFTSSEQKSAPKITGAPRPPTPTGRSSPTSTKDPGEMSPSAYRDARQKGLIR